MTRTNLVMLALLLVSALYLVDTTYESRRLFAAIERAEREERALDIDYKRLDAERQTQATHLRVERVAREKLKMRAASPGVTHYVVDPAAAASAPAEGTK
jgi:cell division protein FtsL